MYMYMHMCAVCVRPGILNGEAVRTERDELIRLRAQHTQHASRRVEQLVKDIALPRHERCRTGLRSGVCVSCPFSNYWDEHARLDTLSSPGRRWGGPVKAIRRPARRARLYR